MASMFVGYNINKVNDSMNQIKNEYTKLGITIQQNFTSIKSTLRTNWIGPDEANYEESLVKRLCSLYEKAASIASSSIDMLYNLTGAWIDFQYDNKTDKNLAMTGSASAMKAKITKPVIVANSKIVSYAPQTFSAAQNLGLVNSNSDTQIRKALEKFKDAITNSTKKFSNSVSSVKSAFYGSSQAKKLEEFVNQIGTSLKDVITAIKDYDDNTKKMTKKAYDDSDSSVGKEISKATKDLQDSTGKKSISTRWN